MVYGVRSNQEPVPSLVLKEIFLAARFPFRPTDQDPAPERLVQLLYLCPIHNMNLKSTSVLQWYINFS